MMAPEPLSWTLQVDDRIKEIANRLEDAHDFNHKVAPGLKQLLDDYQEEDKVGPQEFVRGLLRVFKDSETDGTYSQILNKYSDDERHRIEAFLDNKPLAEVGHNFEIGPSLGCREELRKLQEAHEIAHVSATGIVPLRVVDIIDKAKAHLEEAEHKLSDAFHNTLHILSAGLAGHEADSVHTVEASTAPHTLESSASLTVYTNAEFQNWGLNLQYVPKLTCVPRTVQAIQTVVSFAKQHDMSVRCSGYRHSWAPIFGKTGQITISMLDLATATRLPNTASLPFKEPPPTELETIEKVQGTPRVAGNSLVRLGCATTNERLRRWCVKNNSVTLPINVIMVEITLGGSNAPICHGAGRRHQTLSDLVRKIEYVDANGILRSVDNVEHLRAASGCFGLMGVVTHITLEFSPMTYAVLKPEKMPVSWAVPPPADLPVEQIPRALRADWQSLSPSEKAKRQADFESRAANNFYCEWFWFPYSDWSWVNTWDDTTDASGVVEFPSNTQVVLSWLQTVTINIMQNAPLLDKLISVTGLSEASVTLLSRLAMFVLPAPEQPIKTYLPDALHFQRAIQNVRVRDMEVEMPLVAKHGDPEAVNWQLVQRAWWDAVLLVYANNRDCPMRMPLEMRIMGDSNVIMAPQRGNHLGTCSIEVLTLYSAREIWRPFAQAVLNKWIALRDPATGEPLRTRPHWAKEWAGYEAHDQLWSDRLRHDYAAERKEFLDTLAEIGRDAGWTLIDIKARFSNDTFDQFFFAEEEVAVAATDMPIAATTTTKLRSVNVDTQEVTAVQ